MSVSDLAYIARHTWRDGLAVFSAGVLMWLAAMILEIVL